MMGDFVKYILAIAMLLQIACAKSSETTTTSNPGATFYGYSENGVEASVSKITFAEVFGEGRYKISQAVIRKSDGAVLRSNTVCGDFTMQNGYVMAELGGSYKGYTLDNVTESPYMPESQSPVQHLKSSPNAALIDSALASQASCFLN